MFPLIIIAFAGVGVTRLALLALELHEASNPPEEPFPSRDEVSKETTVEAMRRMDKPKKLILKNECQFVCIWGDEDLDTEIPLETLLEGAALDKKSTLEHDMMRALQDLTDFWDGFVSKTAGLLKPKAAGDGQRTGLAAASSPLPAAAASMAPPAVGRAEPPAAAMHEAPVTSACYDNRHVRVEEKASSLLRGPEDTCLVCYDHQPNAVLLTCGHGALCFNCAVDVYRTNRECPLCRSQVDQIVTVGPIHIAKNGLTIAQVTGPY